MSQNESLLAIAAATAKGLSVPAGVIGGNLVLGINWQPWVYLLTAAWLLVQIGLAVWDRVIHPYIKRRRKD